MQNETILPGATLGVLGSGQLGRMFAVAAARLGYRVHVYSPPSDGLGGCSPAGQVAAEQTISSYEDQDALARFARSVDLVTLEFENIPAAMVDHIEQLTPVRPGAEVLHVSQNRLREKRFLQEIGIATAPFAEVTTDEQLRAAVDGIGLPAVLKTSDSGYDGKGQAILQPGDDATEAWTRIDRQAAILEGWVDYEQELSVLVARSPRGEIVTYGPIANDHANHILDTSKYPATELAHVAGEALELGRSIAEHLDLIGICCVELFLTRAGQLMVNEIAPRPHNSGHLTIEACQTSQFEQQVRAVCNLPLGSTDVVSPAAMANLLGDLWRGGAPLWSEALSTPHLHLHLYGKDTAQPGRKMGHMTVLAQSAQIAREMAGAARNRLSPPR